MEVEAIDFNAIKFWIDTAFNVLTFVVVIVMFLMKGKLTTRSELEEQKLKIAILETTLKSMPTHNDINDFNEKLTQLIQNNSEVTGELRHINRSIESLRENELRKTGANS